MSRKHKRGYFSPDVNEQQPITIFLNHGGGDRSSGGGGRIIGRNKKRIIESFTLPKDSTMSTPVRFLIQIGTKVASAIRDVSMRRRSSRKVSSSSSSTLVRSYSVSDHTTDSHRAEAVEDCIEFLHSSSTRERPS
ncbi:uncharacterized protein LOC130975329 [Arachis stenosperma]|uniref:uncharacterized protein LOC130975329 n=1 Tax=Arachis stenosperma TaxID=217475 RepID=UPI0025AC69F6|nr:uncharacterized protein LOC130975329 [Arachis stenosperma]